MSIKPFYAIMSNPSGDDNFFILPYTITFMEPTQGDIREILDREALNSPTDERFFLAKFTSEGYTPISQVEYGYKEC